MLSTVLVAFGVSFFGHLYIGSNGQGHGNVSANPVSCKTGNVPLAVFIIGQTLCQNNLKCCFRPVRQSAKTAEEKQSSIFGTKNLCVSRVWFSTHNKASFHLKANPVSNCNDLITGVATLPHVKRNSHPMRFSVGAHADRKALCVCHRDPLAYVRAFSVWAHPP